MQRQQGSEVDLGKGQKKNSNEKDVYSGMFLLRFSSTCSVSEAIFFSQKIKTKKILRYIHM